MKGEIRWHLVSNATHGSLRSISTLGTHTRFVFCVKVCTLFVVVFR